MKFLIKACIAFLMLSGPDVSYAQIYPFELYGKEIERAQSLAPMPTGFGTFGEDVDFNTGATSFKKTVVSIPGNNSLRVAADFTFRIWDRVGWPPQYEWVQDLPYIAGTHSADNNSSGWVVGSTSSFSKNRCSDPNRLGVAFVVRSSKPPQDNYIAEEYWSGNSLVGVSGGGLIRQSVSSEPTIPGGGIMWATNGGWRFSCYTLSDGSEGYVGHSPGGYKYYFGIPVQGEDITQISSKTWKDDNTFLEVALYKMPLVRIEDQLGNWVNYSSNAITSSDGRSITFTAVSGGVNIGTNGRTWQIRGSSVTNPDGSTWTIAASGTISNTYSSQAGSCNSQQSIPMSYSGEIIVDVKTESNVRGKFTLQPRRHGYSNMPFDCRYISSQGPRYSEWMHFIDEISLVRRELWGPGITTLVHTIDYGAVGACYASSGTQSQPDPCGPSSSNARSVTVSGSDGNSTNYLFGNRFSDNEGLLLSKTTNGAKVETYEYAIPYSSSSGWGNRKPYSLRDYAVVIEKKVTIQQDGMRFVKEVANDCSSASGTLCIDQHYRPIKLLNYSTP